jgi:ferritin-like metal-binding protein YciE
MGQADVVKLLTKNLQQEEKTAQTLEQSMPTLLKQAAQGATAAA